MGGDEIMQKLTFYELVMSYVTLKRIHKELLPTDRSLKNIIESFPLQFYSAAIVIMRKKIPVDKSKLGGIFGGWGNVNFH